MLDQGTGPWPRAPFIAFRSRSRSTPLGRPSTAWHVTRPLAQPDTFWIAKCESGEFDPDIVQPCWRGQDFATLGWTPGALDFKGFRKAPDLAKSRVDAMMGIVCTRPKLRRFRSAKNKPSCIDITPCSGGEEIRTPDPDL